MSATILLQREYADEVQRRTFAWIDLIIEAVVAGMQDADGLVSGQVKLRSTERVAKVVDLTSSGVLAELERIAPRIHHDILRQYDKDVSQLEERVV